MPKPSSDPPPLTVHQASRIYFLPNLMTAGNLFCGFASVIKCIQARMAVRGADLGATPEELYKQAVWFVLVAVIFDSLDGRLARLGGRESLFGAEFDSIADIVSFGVAPALMVYYLILTPSHGYPFFLDVGWFLSFVYLLCAAVRLARFNVITNPLLPRFTREENKDFVGLPVPAAAGTIVSIVLLLVHLSETDRTLQKGALFLPFLLLLIAGLMVSTVRFPSFKQVDWSTRTRFRSFVGVLIVAGLIFMFQEVSFFFLFLGYIGYGLTRHVRRIVRLSRIKKQRGKLRNN